MAGKRNSLILHTTVTRWSTLAMDVDLATRLEFDGLELSAEKVQRYLDAGYSPAELSGLLDGLERPAIGFVVDVERQAAAQQDLLSETKRICQLAQATGAKAIQVITGPVNVRAVQEFNQHGRSDLYVGVLGADAAAQVDLTASSLAKVADLAAEFGLLVYFEGLGWTPINTLERQLAVIDKADRGNLRIVIDFWHCHVSGDTPEDVARVPRELIYGVHVCDSQPFAGGVPDEAILRNVSTGRGVLTLPEWADAVKSTGYDDWWSCELFSTRDQQGHSPTVAASLKSLMTDLVGRP